MEKERTCKQCKYVEMCKIQYTFNIKAKECGVYTEEEKDSDKRLSKLS